MKPSTVTSESRRETNSQELTGQSSSSCDEFTGSQFSTTARDLSANERGTFKRLNNLLSVALVGGVAITGGTLLESTVTAGVISIPFAWEPSPDPGVRSYTFYGGFMRPGAPTNDITSLDIFGSVVIPSGTASNLTVNIGGVGPGSYLGFYMVANSNSDGTGDTSVPSNMPTMVLSTSEYLARRVTNATQVAVSYTSPLALRSIDSAPPPVTLELEATGTNTFVISISGLRPADSYTLEAAPAPNLPFSPIYNSIVPVNTVSSFENLIIPNSGTQKFFRVKRNSS